MGEAIVGQCQSLHVRPRCARKVHNVCVGCGMQVCSPCWKYHECSDLRAEDVLDEDSSEKLRQVNWGTLLPPHLKGGKE